MTSLTPRVGFAALGVLSAGLGAGHLALQGSGVGSLLESALIVGLSGFVFYTVYDLPDWGISVSGRWRAVRIAALTALSFAALAGVVWLIWLLEHHAFKLSFLISFAASLGAAVGSRAGPYAVKADEQLAEAQELATLLSINDRVLRHNIRNELSVGLGYLDGIEDVEDDAEVAERAAIARTHLEALVETSERTRRIASIWRTESRQSFDLVAVVEERVAELTAEAPGVAVRTELPDRCLVRAHPSLPLAIEEALRNAIEHNDDDVTVTVRVDRDDDATTLSIADTGRGIPEIERETLRNAEETPLEHTEGLGLWLIYWTVTRAGGTVEFAENDPHGTVVRIRLPDHLESDGSIGPVPEAVGLGDRAERPSGWSDSDFAGTGRTDPDQDGPA
ncbi:histidine kinase [Halorubrum distributum JCM 13561]|uniref:Histidine kinase n=1 Tax=Halorubrum distributum JCM 13561 TaxID=1227483 RepID=M0P292_9EURY|nr:MULTISPECIES: HAMP domain-containing sensor histidine kinase [Halorubrum distributum group]EMA64196.1 histidine kinase [Halorubrum litoreum JCM 13561]MDV7349462.1 HAMP domain-containing sensor histidine kinase [Halorubrum distributum]